MECILVIDQGTTGSQVAIYQMESLKSLAQVKVDFDQHFPSPGWVEHHPQEIWLSVEKAAEQAFHMAFEKTKTKVQIKAVGITNQRESCLAWNKKTKELAGPVIVWQDRRTSLQCEKIKENQDVAKRICATTGLIIDPYFSSTKLAWIMKNEPKAQEWAADGDLALGTIDSYLIFKLTDGKSFFTDHTNASRTQLYSLESGKFCTELCELFEVPFVALPEVLPSQMEYPGFGLSKNVSFLPDGIPILATIGDQQSALYGHNCLKKGDAKLTFGTGSFALLSTGNARSRPTNGILETVGFSTTQGRTFALEASAFCCGAALNFLVENLGIIDNLKNLESFAQKDPRDPNLIFVPALTGLGAPWWLSQAKGALFGLTRGTSKPQIARAFCEAVVLQNTILLKIMETSAGVSLETLAVDGGPTQNSFLMQMQADCLGIPILRPENHEVTAYGAAQAVFQMLSKDKLQHTNTDEKKTVFQPNKKEAAQWVDRINQFERACRNVSL